MGMMNTMIMISLKNCLPYGISSSAVCLQCHYIYTLLPYSVLQRLISTKIFIRRVPVQEIIVIFMCAYIERMVEKSCRYVHRRTFLRYVNSVNFVDGIDS